MGEGGGVGEDFGVGEAQGPGLIHPTLRKGAKDGALGHPQRRDTGVSPLRRGSAPPAVEMTSVFG
jgi:hypothetical protein